VSVLWKTVKNPVYYHRIIQVVIICVLPTLFFSFLFLDINWSML